MQSGAVERSGEQRSYGFARPADGGVDVVNSASHPAAGGETIAFRGAWVRARSDGRAEIQLQNGHRITAIDVAPLDSRPARGDLVRVELPFDQVTGWRVVRRLRAS